MIERIRRRTVVGPGLGLGLAAALVAVTGAPAQGQDPIGTHAQQVQDLGTLKDKFVSLARAFEAGHMDWRPMEGTRSVKDVIDLMVAEVHLFPGIWGVAPPAGTGSGFGAEIARVAAMDADAAIAQLESGFDFMIASVEGLDPDRLHETADWFGTPYTVEGAIAQALGDMHEHLGQFIAYARSNGVVPPWSG